MYKIKFIIFIALFTIFCSCNNFNSPKDGFKVEGNIENSQDCSQINAVMAFVPDHNAKISESKLQNNYFSLFLPYEMEDKYCSAIGNNKYNLFEAEFENNLTISDKNVKISKVYFSSDKEYLNDIQQLGYTEKLYDNDDVAFTFVKTKYIYAQSAVSVKGEYDTYTAQTPLLPTPLPKKMNFDLQLKKGWNVVYYVGYFVQNTYYALEIDTATIKITTEKPENIELNWYYRITQQSFFVLCKDTQMIPNMIHSCYYDFIVL